MGTNYFLKSKKHPDATPIHIGKSSAGWCFALHVIPQLDINSLDDWKKLFYNENNIIENEYNEEILHDQMMIIITERKGREDRQTGQQLDPYTIVGPNGLVRHPLDEKWVVAHGEGTWDCLVGEFS